MLVRACRPVCRLTATGISHIKPSASLLLLRVRFLATEAENTPSSQTADNPPPSNSSESPSDTDKNTNGRTRARSTRASRDTNETVVLPDNLDILWSTFDTEIPKEILPPLPIFSDALDKLNLSLHPHNQRRAAFPNASLALEPTLCLYCPIEGMYKREFFGTPEFLIHSTRWRLHYRCHCERPCAFNRS
jgi:hypothetical protein